jgi:hypothetical protein
MARDRELVFFFSERCDGIENGEFFPWRELFEKKKEQE